MRNPSEEQLLDDMLATFTDRLLGAQGVEDQGPAISEQQEELRDLQMTVVRLKQAGATALPDAQFAARVQNRLLAEWNAELFPRKAPLEPLRPPSLVERVLAAFRPRPQRGMVLRLGLAVIAVLFLALILLPDYIPQLSGAAGGGALWQPVAGILGLLCAIALVWLFAKKGDE